MGHLAAPLLPTEAPPELREAPAELGLRAAVRWLVEALAAELIRQQGLVDHPARLIVGIGVPHPAAELPGARVVGVAQIRGWRRRAALADVRLGAPQTQVGRVRLRRQREV